MSEAGNKTSPSSSNSQSTSTCSQLPTALIAPILARIDQEQRLSACAGVSRSWAKAAAQATPDICCKLSDESTARFKSWGKLHGPYLRTLVLSGPALYYDALPCVQLPWQKLTGLQRLDLARLALPAISSTGDSTSSGSDSPAAAGTRVDSSSTSHCDAAATPLLPSLKQLQLTDCNLGKPETLLRLADSPRLTSLVIQDQRTYASNAYAGIACELVQRLPQLVVLRVPALGLGSSIMPHVAALRNLQDLELNMGGGDHNDERDDDVDEPCEDCWNTLPRHLTRFGLTDSRGKVYALKEPVPPMLPDQVLQALSLLQHLTLDSGWPVENLASLTRSVQHLRLDGCTLRPKGADGVEALLSVLLRLTQLQHLHLDNMGLQQLQQHSLHRFAALTASSHLTHLHLATGCQQPLPAGCAQFMLAADRQLPQLRVLSIFTSYFGGRRTERCLASADLQRIVSCCPQLQALNVAGTMCRGSDLSALRQLPSSLTSLTVGGDGFQENAAYVLTKLTQLSHLAWRQNGGHWLADTALLELTSLTGLTELTVSGLDEFLQEAGDWEFYMHPDELEIPDMSADLTLRATKAKGPVWRQLLAVCANSPECASEVALQLLQQVVDLEKQVQDLKQQLADREAQVLELQRRLAECSESGPV